MIPPRSSIAGAPRTDRVAALQSKLDSGDATLAYESGPRIPETFLKELDIPVSSQMLVFSKTSFQGYKIEPQAPRALYFNDEVYVGWVRNSSVFEVSAVDPQLGAIFYMSTQEPDAPPRFQRQTDACLQCHDSASATLGIPGHLVRSVFAGSDGMPHYGMGGFRTTFRSPLSERWGGWYVTGTHGAMRHLGNVTFADEAQPDLKRAGDRGANLTDLSRKRALTPTWPQQRHRGPHGL